MLDNTNLPSHFGVVYEAMIDRGSRRYPRRPHATLTINCIDFRGQTYAITAYSIDPSMISKIETMFIGANARMIISRDPSTPTDYKGIYANPEIVDLIMIPQQPMTSSAVEDRLIA